MSCCLSDQSTKNSTVCATNPNEAVLQGPVRGDLSEESQTARETTKRSSRSARILGPGAYRTKTNGVRGRPNAVVLGKAKGKELKYD